MLCLNLIIPKYNLRELIFGGGGLIHRRSFPFQKLVPKRPGAYTRWGLLSEFNGILRTKVNHLQNVCLQTRQSNK